MGQNIHLARAVLLIIVASTMLIANESWLQRPNVWSSEKQITKSLWDSRLVDLSADSSSHVVYLTWEDNREGVEEVYFKRSLDDGITWGPDVRLSHLTHETPEPEPRLATSSGQIIVFFANRTAVGEHLFYSVSYDWGIDFSTPLQLTRDSGDQSNAAVAFVASTIHLVWQQYLGGEDHIFYAKSISSGRTWQREVDLTNLTATQDQYPAISAIGDRVFVTWSRMQGGTEAVFARASLDSGDTWQPEVQVSGYTGDVYPEFPAITTNGTEVHLVWGSSLGLQYSRSSDSGETWFPPILLTDASRQYVAPRIAIAMPQIQVVTAAIASGSSEIYYLTSPDGGETWNIPTPLTAHESPAFSLAPVIWSNRDGTFVAWEDNRKNHFVIFFLSRPDFMLLREYEWQLFAPVAIVLIAAVGVYLEIELRTSRQESIVRPRRGRGRRIKARGRARMLHPPRQMPSHSSSSLALGCLSAEKGT